jgi:hypothetical protein
LCILENHPLRPVQSGGRDPDLRLVSALASPTRWSNAKIVEKPVPFFNVEKRPSAHHVYHAFHHNLTTKKPRPTLPFLKKTPQKPRSTSYFLDRKKDRKNCFQLRRRKISLLRLSSYDFYCGDFGTWKSTVTVCWTPLLVAVTVIG